LPQYHPTPENDEWWGKGFTEWTNVTKAIPLIPGHYQPHLPADLGFYDLRLPEARLAQGELAREYGINGFVYYHYWFNGRRVLDRPVREILQSGEPDFPFCLCWANEDWTRAWDGDSGHRLLHQEYSQGDDLAHIRHLLPYLADKRYIRIDNRPLLLVYRTEELPDAGKTAEIWRNEAIRSGLGDLYLASVESFVSDVDPKTIGFDAAVEFAPDWRKLQSIPMTRLWRYASRLGLLSKGWVEHNWTDYETLVKNMLAKQEPGYRRFRCVTPGFDNSPRRAKGATIILNSTPQAYGRWLEDVIRRESLLGSPPDQQIVFVNAWNEWGEGNHLEPDQKWGRAYLEATLAARNTPARLAVIDSKK